MGLLEHPYNMAAKSEQGRGCGVFYTLDLEAPLSLPQYPLGYTGLPLFSVGRDFTRVCTPGGKDHQGGWLPHCLISFLED